MAILHVVVRSAGNSPALQQCLDRARRGDGIILIGDGVYAALHAGEAARRLEAAMAEGVECYCLRPDLDTRGLAALQLLAGMETVDYGGFVDLAARFPRSCAW